MKTRITLAIPLVLASLLAHSRILASPKEPKQLGASEPTPEEVTLAVTDKSGNHLGSAVSIQSERRSHWAVTNNHVVGKLGSVCLTDGAGVSYAFRVVHTPTNLKRSNQADIAFLWAPTDTTIGFKAASLPKILTSNAKELPIVEATGFPTPSNGEKRASLTKTTGLLLPLLEDELEEGFDTTYTADVQKGMSGGGVFSNNKLIAINGAHSDPLWPVQWRRSTGEFVPKELNEKLELVSIGLSVRVIRRELQRVRDRYNPSKEHANDIRCGAGSSSPPST